MRGPPGCSFDRSRLLFKARQVKLLDHSPNLPGRVILVDQALDIELLQDLLVAVDRDVARRRGTLFSRHTPSFGASLPSWQGFLHNFEDPLDPEQDGHFRKRIVLQQGAIQIDAPFHPEYSMSARLGSTTGKPAAFPQRKGPEKAVEMHPEIGSVRPKDVTSGV
jgi:hypothetical protein